MPNKVNGNRDDAAFGLAGHLISFDPTGTILTDSDVLNILNEWDKGNSPPLGEQELRTKVHSARVNGVAREPKGTPDDRPLIVLTAGEISRSADHVEEIFGGQTQPPVFQRGGRLVRVSDSSSLSDDLLIHELGDDALIDEMCKVAKFECYKGDKPRACNPPKDLAKLVNSRAGKWKLPELKGVVATPQLLRDGRIIDKPGYDRKSGIYLLNHGVNFAPIPDRPPKDDAYRALGQLNELLASVEFVDEIDRSVALAMILTGVARHAVLEAPLFAISAPAPWSGKSSLAAVPAILATGLAPAVLDPGWNDQEMDKRMLAGLVSGVSFISFDNLQKPLGGAAICTAITEPTYSGRPMGFTKIVTMPTTGVLWTATGQNVVICGDLNTRTVMSHLDTREEDPSKHRWRGPNPRLVALQRRAELVPAVLTVLKAYEVAGKPDMGLSQYRLEEWSSTMRSPLVWLGMPDPLGKASIVSQRDPELEPLAALMTAWDAQFGEQAFTVAQVVDATPDCRPLRDAIVDVAGDGNGGIDRVRLGKYISHSKDTIVGGRYFELAKEGRVARWALRPCVISN